MNKHNKYRIAVVLLISISVMLPLWGQESTFGQAFSEPSKAMAFKVAMLLPGPVNDMSWNSTGYQGLLLIKQELGATIAYTENVAEGDMELLFRKYAKDGADLVIGHGGQFIAPAQKVADEFPRTSFMIVGTYEGNNRNLGAVQFKQHELGYLAGTVAALKTRSNKVAYICGMPYIHMKEKGTLFILGAKAANPRIEARSLTLNTWSKQEAGQACASALVQDKFDVIAVDADTAGIPIHQAARKARIYTLGWATDQYNISPETILTSGIQRTDIIIFKGAELVRLGRWEGKLYKFGIRDRAQDLAPFRGMLSPEEQREFLRIKNKIMEGEINLMNLQKPFEPQYCP